MESLRAHLQLRMSPKRIAILLLIANELRGLCVVAAVVAAWLHHT